MKWYFQSFYEDPSLLLVPGLWMFRQACCIKDAKVIDSTSHHRWLPQWFNLGSLVYSALREESSPKQICICYIIKHYDVFIYVVIRL